MKLTRYQDFLERVDELGFMALSNRALPALFAEIPDNSAFTGDPDTDAWIWKDRAAEEKKLAYGCILGGHRGFVSARMYPLFYTAYQPEDPMELRWNAGEVNETTWQLWQLFEKKTILSTYETRQEMGVTAKSGGSRVDAGIRELQRAYYITSAGNKRKLNKHGQPYGWPACVYETVESWAPEGWLDGTFKITPAEAREKIFDHAMTIVKNLSREELAKILGMA